MGSSHKFSFVRQSVNDLPSEQGIIEDGNQANPQSGTEASPSYLRTMEFIRNGEFERALRMLNSGPGGSECEHIKAVCLLRLCRDQDAINVLRGLVIRPGTCWTRYDVPLLYKTNFATALLLGGFVRGCCEVLAEINEESSPLVIRLRESINTWEQGLTFWQRFNWRFGSLEPSKGSVIYDHEPGDFLDPGQSSMNGSC